MNRHPSTHPSRSSPSFDNNRNIEAVKRFFGLAQQAASGLDYDRLTAISLIDDRKMPSKTANSELCCPPEPAQPELNLLTLEGAEADEELAKLAKAIGHPARIRILRMLSRKEARVCSQIVDELPLAQSTVSEHLRILKEAGLVRCSQDGPRVGYCINFDGLRRLKALVAII